MTDEELQAFIRAEWKQSLLRQMQKPFEDRQLRAMAIYATPRFDKEGSTISVDHATETVLMDLPQRNNAYFAPKESEELTLQQIKAAYELLRPCQEDAIQEALDAREAAIRELSAAPPIIPWSFLGEAAKPVRPGQLVTLRDDGFVEPAGAQIEPKDIVTFTVTNEPANPWPAPYRSLDADFRTSSEEWKQNVRERFAVRTGEELLRLNAEKLQSNR